MTKSFSNKNHRIRIGPRKSHFSSSSWSPGLTPNGEIHTDELYTISEQLNRSLALPKVKNIYVSLKQGSIADPASNLSTNSNANTASNSIQNSDSSSSLIHTLKYSYCPSLFDGCMEHDDENNPYNSMNYIDDVLTQSAPANEIFQHNNPHISGRNMKGSNAEPFRKFWKWCTHSISGDYQ